MEGGGGTEADSCESEKGTLSRGLRGANDASSTSESGSESHSSPGAESGAERGSERGLISDSESVIMAMTVAVAKSGFKGRLQRQASCFARGHNAKKGSQFHQQSAQKQ